MKYKYRTQNEPDCDELSLETGLSTDHLPDLARQEFLQETDVNVIIKKFGLPAPPLVSYAETDFDVDLQAALEMIREVRTGFHRIDPRIRARYPNWVQLTRALESGELADFLTAMDKPPENGADQEKTEQTPKT